MTKDVPPYSVVVGVPAKFVRSRFSEKTIDHLQRIKWWDMEDKDIFNMADAVSPDGPLDAEKLERWMAESING